MLQDPKSLADWLVSMTPEARVRFLDGLSPNALLSLPWLFDLWAMAGHQLPPAGDWSTWVILGGRGAGKTRAGAEWVRAQVEGATPMARGTCRRVALVAETLEQAREVMVFGESGLLACSAPDRRPHWIATRRLLQWPNGAEAQLFSAKDPERLRGPQFDAAWCDELAKWKLGEAAWDMLQFGLRLGKNPRAVVTTTPRNRTVLTRLLEDKRTVVTQAATTANRANLAKVFLDNVLERYANTRLARQELQGELLVDEPGALWRHADIEAAHLAPAFTPNRIVVAVDPPVTGHSGSDEFGIIVAGVLTEGPPQLWRGIILEEVMRATEGHEPAPRDLIEAVALIPGTGEYALATEPVHYTEARGQTRSANSNGDAGPVDILDSLEQLNAELPHVGATSLVVSWFGDDLRCNECEIYPAVEQAVVDGDPMPWRVNGVTRAGARLISQTDGRPNYGGTPTDASVVQAIAALRDAGKAITFYPFVLMDVAPDNSLPNPYDLGNPQPAFPWRGRITTSAAPGQPGSPEMTASAANEVAAFFGTAGPGHFSVSGTQVNYTGPAEFSYRRFILHYAHLCAATGGVDAFLIGSELRGLTCVRASQTNFPTVSALRALAADVRTILGPQCKISYAADWSEYGAYRPGGGDVLFHLDPLWADDNIDFIGIDNYLPISDWRDAEVQADSAKSIYDLDYLQANIEGGEYFDWYYINDESRRLQHRRPIEDGAYDEAWIYRAKDLRSWWGLPHSNRLNGVREANYTAWEPQSKPIWFTELGCPAIDKGTNQPNVFYDAKSSESAVPYFSSGA